jgi:hypothetical protein
MFGFDKYSMMSFIPSVAIVVVCVGLVVVGVSFLKKNIAADAAKAEEAGK